MYRPYIYFATYYRIPQSTRRGISLDSGIATPAAELADPFREFNSVTLHYDDDDDGGGGGEGEGDDQYTICLWIGREGLGLPVCRSNYMYRIPVSTDPMKRSWGWLSRGKSSCSSDEVGMVGRSRLYIV